jgi:hypothetical protein
VNRFFQRACAELDSTALAAGPILDQAATSKAKPQAGMAADMTARCQAMMADHEKMMAELKAADEALSRSA